MREVTQILKAIGDGHVEAAEDLLPLVYSELRRLAAARLAHERPGQTLQATALVHEAYLRLTKDEEPVSWANRGHFFAAAAEAMRRIMVESARRKHRQRHGGDFQRVELDDAAAAIEPPSEDLLALDEALQAFEQEEPEKARLVKLRYFAGLSEEQAAEALGVSRATAARWWAFARAWLFNRLQNDDS
jgi:RNA polymerase sigma factor (TIGR02999 family)